MQYNLSYMEFIYFFLGSKELLLEQKVPASYIALEDVITHLVSERRANNADPVLNAEQYKSTVSMEMQKLCNKSFRDAAELHQATLFLHENGMLPTFVRSKLNKQLS